MSQITLKDVAKEAGVAVSTVSLILNNKGQFSQDVRDRVYEIAQKIGYIKSPSTPSGARRFSEHVAILVSEDIEKDFTWNVFNRMIAPLETAIARERLYLVVIPINVQQETKEISEKIAASKAKALFSFEYANPELFQELEEHGIPVIVISSSTIRAQINSVCIDNVQGAYDGTKYLLSLGHTQIHYLDYLRPDAQMPLNDRFVGFKMALEEHQFNIPEDVRVLVDESNMNELQRKLKRLVQRTIPPTAIFAHDDYLAARVLVALQNLHVRVPEDISLIAIGDMLDYNQPFIPRITTMQINNQLMGKLAGEMLLERLKNDQTGIHILKVNQQLVERGSCLKIPDKKKFARFVQEKNAEERTQEYHIGVTCFSLNLTYWAMWAQAVWERARETETKVSLLPCLSATEQAAAIRRFISQGLDAIIIGPIDGTNPDVALAAKEAMQAGIPVVVSSVELEGVQVNCTVRCDNLKGGELAASYLLDQIGGEGKIALIEGSWPQLRIQGFRKALNSATKRFIAFEAKCDWSREAARDAMREALRLHPDLKGVFAACDPMALGALDAIAEAQQQRDIVIVGFDGLPEACVAIYNDRLRATINQAPFEVGTKVLDAAIRILHGKTVLSSLLVEPMLVSKQNVIETTLNMLGLMPQILHSIAEISEEQRLLHTEHLRMDTESQIAIFLQRMFLSSAGELQEIDGLDITGFTGTPRKIENGLLTGIGDMTTHSLEGGLLMLMFQTEIHTLIDHGPASPVEFLGFLRHLIADNTAIMSAVRPIPTIFVRAHQMCLKIIGKNNLLLVLRQDGEIEHCNAYELRLSQESKENFDEIAAQATIVLQPDEGLIMYANSLIDSENQAGEPYGAERLGEVARRNWTRPVEEVKQAIFDDVKRHIGNQTVYDELTLTVLKYAIPYF
ncbi:response regulator receiver modulated serine phosphatase [Candidatus Moduliflexus flocculans]|uniref:Response regulator receiver modulated serine phosphatase n=1 Tax=Candidatus Moduliflexus flocculans TaxID=1499966 RepID=A0A081BRH8_9BACT|nr:response regulator receiver modulated serine phosphatase [Candidatus Moduliflexus flocculans]